MKNENIQKLEEKLRFISAGVKNCEVCPYAEKHLDHEEKYNIEVDFMASEFDMQRRAEGIAHANCPQDRIYPYKITNPTGRYYQDGTEITRFYFEATHPVYKQICKLASEETTTASCSLEDKLKRAGLVKECENQVQQEKIRAREEKNRKEKWKEDKEDYMKRREEFRKEFPLPLDIDSYLVNRFEKLPAGQEVLIFSRQEDCGILKPVYCVPSKTKYPWYIGVPPDNPKSRGTVSTDFSHFLNQEQIRYFQNHPNKIDTWMQLWHNYFPEPGQGSAEYDSKEMQQMIKEAILNIKLPEEKVLTPQPTEILQQIPKNRIQEIIPERTAIQPKVKQRTLWQKLFH